ncbi:MAG: hypothetical protein AABY09_03805 [Nanoarchaeota archaeon]
MEAPTIKIYEDTKTELDKLREYKNESYDEVLKKIIFIVNKFKTEPKLSKEAITSIERARERLKKGQFLTEEQARKRLGL